MARQYGSNLPAGREQAPPPRSVEQVREPAKPNGYREAGRRGGKKRLRAVLIALAVIIVVGAIGSRNSGRAPDRPVQDPAVPSQTEPREATGVNAAGEDAPSVPGVGDLGKYHVEIKGATLAEDYQGQPAIVVTYQWTNNSDKTTSAMAALDGDAFQDGIGLETAIMMNPDVHDGNAYMTEIRPGASLDVSLAYVLKNTASVVEFELSELISFSNDVVSIDFDPGAM